MDANAMMVAGTHIPQGESPGWEVASWGLNLGAGTCVLRHAYLWP